MVSKLLISLCPSILIYYDIIFQRECRAEIFALQLSFSKSKLQCKIRRQLTGLRYWLRVCPYIFNQTINVPIWFWIIKNTDSLVHYWTKHYYRPRSRGDNTFGSVRPSVRLSVRPSVRPSVRLSVNALTAEPFDLRPWFLAWGLTLTLARFGLKVKVVGQRSRSNFEKMCFDMIFSTCFEVKVKGQSSRSINLNLIPSVFRLRPYTSDGLNFQLKWPIR